MGWKEWPNWRKGLILGLIGGFLQLLFYAWVYIKQGRMDIFFLLSSLIVLAIWGFIVAISFQIIMFLFNRISSSNLTFMGWKDRPDWVKFGFVFGTIGVLYFIIIFAYDKIFICRSSVESCGFLIAITNPTTIIGYYLSAFIYHTLTGGYIAGVGGANETIATVYFMLTTIVINFVIGFVIGVIVGRIYGKIKQKKSVEVNE